MITRTLIERGSSHKLRCEDDLFTLEFNSYIIGAIFDGCSSGTDSHFSSTLLKKILKRIVNDAVHDKQFNLKWDNKESHDVNIVKGLALRLHEESNSKSLMELINYVHNSDLLSTVTIILVNKIINRYTVLFCGDGVLSVDGEITTIHDEDGDMVDYLVPQDESQVQTYIDNRPLYQGYFKKTVSISSDGIDTFKDQFGENQSKEAKELLFNSTDFYKQNIMLNRKYNMLIKVYKYLNQDDVSIIRFINE